MSAEISGACFEPYSKVSNIIEETFNKSLSKHDYGQSVESWDYIVILLPPDMAKHYEEIEKYHKNDKSLEFRLKIDNKKFKNGDEATQMELVCESLLRSLDMPVIKSLPSFDYEKLKKDFTKLCEDKNWF